jgi:HKD family nuclease
MNDLTFFSNDEQGTLLERFHRILKGVKTLDVLVGYFRASGFNIMEGSLEKCQKIRILVGIDVDNEVNDWFQKAKQQITLDFETDEKTKEKALSHVLQGINSESEYSKESYESVHKFIQYIQEGRLEIRAYRKGKIHAKVYIVKYDEEVGTEYGKVITGSSNFSYSGLVGNREFNVELKNRADVDFASGQFEELWKDGVEISQEFISLIQTKTWMRNDVTPYELYLKMLSEYFKEELFDDKDKWKGVPDGYFELRYQKDAVIELERNLKKYGGAFLSDVVGLGKTYIAAMLAKRMGGRNLIICPPVLKENWISVLRDFGVANYRVESRGMLEKIAEEEILFDTVFIDESHYFRNQKTQSYALLDKIVAGSNVVCISATPQNNYPADLESQLYLFQNKKDSYIEGVRDLETFFNAIHYRYKGGEKERY